MGDNSIICVLVHICSMPVSIPHKYEIIICVGFPSKYLRREEWEMVDKMIDREL